MRSKVWELRGALMLTSVLGACAGGTDTGNPFHGGSWLAENKEFLVSTTSQDCVVLTNPVTSVEGFEVAWPETRLGDPRAEDPSFVYLERGRDGIDVQGPTVFGKSFNDLSALDITAAGVVRGTAPDGFDGAFSVDFADTAVSFRVSIRDHEGEVDLAEVHLCKDGTSVTSHFVFVGIGDGVAHDAQIELLNAGTLEGTSGPLTIEVRPPRSALQTESCGSGAECRIGDVVAPKLTDCPFAPGADDVERLCLLDCDGHITSSVAVDGGVSVAPASSCYGLFVQFASHVKVENIDASIYEAPYNVESEMCCAEDGGTSVTFAKKTTAQNALLIRLDAAPKTPTQIALLLSEEGNQDGVRYTKRYYIGGVP